PRPNQCAPRRARRTPPRKRRPPPRQRRTPRRMPSPAAGTQPAQGTRPMTRPRLLDLYCCEGGAAMGYNRAGFDITGVDTRPQPRYPFEFHQGDALEYLAAHGAEFDVIHASPPCQAYTALRVSWNARADHPD